MITDKRRARLIQRIQRDDFGCWSWLGYHDKDGYAVASFDDRPQRVHRVMLALSGVDVPAGAIVRHRCDNAGCVRPDHLLLGTQADNMRDMVERGRSLVGDLNPARRRPQTLARGERHGCAKLTAVVVAAIRARRVAAPELTYDQLSAEFGVNRSTVFAICSRRIWRHVP